MKKYFFILILCFLINAKAPAQSGLDYFKSINKEIDLTKLMVKNELNPYSPQSNKVSSEKTESKIQITKQDFCSNIVEIIALLKDKNIRDYFLDKDNETKDYVRYNSEKKLDNLFDENQITYFKKLDEYVFRASSDFENQKEMFEMLDYYLTFFNDCEFLIPAIQKKEKNDSGFLSLIYTDEKEGYKITIEPSKINDNLYCLFVDVDLE